MTIYKSQVKVLRHHVVDLYQVLDILRREFKHILRQRSLTVPHVSIPSNMNRFHCLAQMAQKHGVESDLVFIVVGFKDIGTFCH